MKASQVAYVQGEPGRVSAWSRASSQRQVPALQALTQPGSPKTKLQAITTTQFANESRNKIDFALFKTTNFAAFQNIQRNHHVSSNASLDDRCFIHCCL
jgi:hypothetical protein